MLETHHARNRIEVGNAVWNKANPNPVVYVIPGFDSREFEHALPQLKIRPAFSFPLHDSSDILSEANLVIAPLVHVFLRLPWEMH